MFNKYVAQQYIHMDAIGSVLSLVKARGRQLGIVNRSEELAKPIFVLNEELDKDLI
jgi:hypothetical protein